MEPLGIIDANSNRSKEVSCRKRSGPIVQTIIRSRTILFVDEEPLIQRARRIIFEALGYCVLTAATSEDALAALRSNIVDAVVLDYLLPGIGGEATVRRIRITNPRVPIVLCSSHPRVPRTVSKIVDAVVDKARVHALLALLEQLIDEPPMVTLRAYSTAV